MALERWHSFFVDLCMQPRFSDKVIVITGATGGVGRATARAFAREGARIALLARGQEQLAATQSEVERLGGRALAIPTDVADPAQVEAAAERTERELGPIDIWVNNAMTSVFAPIKEITPEEFHRVTEVTYLGQVYGTMAALRRMLPRDRGSIILVGSALAYRGIPLQSAYCGAKHGIEGFYDSLRCELLHDHSSIRTCMVQLPAMNTTQFGWVLNKLSRKPKPMGKIYEPEVAAAAILYAAVHNRRSIWVGSSTYKAIIGNKLSQSFADHELARIGYEGQLTAEPTAPGQPNNLWQPVAEDRGTHGNFAAQSANHSLTLWAARNRGWIAAITGIIALSALLLPREHRH